MRYVSLADHVMRPCVPESSSRRPEIQCFHWTDRHTEDPTNTWDWINGFACEFYVRLQQLLGIRDHDSMVREIDRRAMKRDIGVEELLDELLGVKP